MVLIVFFYTVVSQASGGGERKLEASARHAGSGIVDTVIYAGTTSRQADARPSIA